MSYSARKTTKPSVQPTVHMLMVLHVLGIKELSVLLTHHTLLVLHHTLMGVQSITKLPELSMICGNIIEL